MPTEDVVWLCIGDVSGKGVPAALLMAVTKTLIKSFATQSHPPGEVVTHVNEELSRDNESAMFVTAFISQLNLATGELRYTNAGHNPPLVRRAGGVVERLGSRHGAVLGAAEGVTYGESAVMLAPGDTIVLFTDGVTEALDTSEQLFTEQRLQQVLRDQGDGSAKEVATAVMGAVDTFAYGAEQADDITLLSLRYNPHSMSAVPNRHLLYVANDLREVAAALKQVEDLVAQCGGNREAQVRFATACDELLSNTITYGFPEPGAHLIECEVRREADAIKIVIADDGLPFNPLDQPDPDTTLPLEARRIGGLGIHLVRRLFEEVHYRREAGRNVVTLAMKI
jgi:anti-sigma regulatory factor (Ser/Thr protein kinase)